MGGQAKPSVSTPDQAIQELQHTSANMYVGTNDWQSPQGTTKCHQDIPGHHCSCVQSSHHWRADRACLAAQEAAVVPVCSEQLVVVPEQNAAVCAQQLVA